MLTFATDGDGRKFQILNGFTRRLQSGDDFALLPIDVRDVDHINGEESRAKEKDAPNKSLKVRIGFVKDITYSMQ